MSGQELSARDARRAFLRAQGVRGAPDRRGGVPRLLRRLGAVQLDTISVLARSHELVAYARLGAVGRNRVEEAYWGTPPRAFEYWAHAACVLPLDVWPLFAFRRRALRERYRARLAELAPAVREVRARLEADGPLTATDLGGARRGGPWWDWSATKVAVETLLSVGEVVCVRRRGWRRVYDLTERVLGQAALAHEPDDRQCWTELVRLAGQRLGVATPGDLADYYRLRRAEAEAGLPGSGLVRVRVEGWESDAWADQAALAALGTRGRNRTTLLSPFDSLVWDRARTERIFGLSHRLEAYVPRDRRVHGYFAMPVLAGGRLLGRVDPAREGRTLVARQVSLAPRVLPATAAAPLAAALAEATTWIGADDVAVDHAEPATLAEPLRAELARSGR